MNQSSTEDSVLKLNRREAIRCVSALLGGVALAGGSSLLMAVEAAAATTDSATPGAFTADEIAFLDEVAETILPATQTPGAKAAKVGAFMAVMVSDAYSPAEQRVFRDGMRHVERAMHQRHQVAFMEATSQQRLALLTQLDRDAKASMDARPGASNRRDTEPPHYFRMMKELALLGFFTSEVGCTQVQRYIESPGRFDPCIPYTPGDPAWAAHA